MYVCMYVFRTHVCQKMKSRVCVSRHSRHSDKICNTDSRQEKPALQLEEGIFLPLGFFVCLFMSELNFKVQNRTERLQTQVRKRNRSEMEVQKNKTNIYSYTRRTNKSNSIWFTLLNVKEQ